MEWLYQLEISWIWFIQQLGVWLVEPMRLISTTGTENFFMLIIPILYWSVDAALGIRIAVILLLSNGINAACKLFFHAPRPYWLGTRIQAYSVESSFGLPSGHSQNSAAIWGLLAIKRDKTIEKTFLVVLIFLIGFSRVFLGMHFITDVLAGWVIGALLLFLVIKLEQPVQSWLIKLSFRQMMTAAVLSTLILGGIVAIAYLTVQNWQLPVEWFQNALAAVPEKPIDPIHLDSAFTTAGTWFGLWAGVAWLYHRQGGYNPTGTPRQHVLRYLIGVAGIFFLWFGLGQIFPREADWISYSLRFIRYTMVGLWVSAMAPLVFQKINLAKAPR